MNNSVFEVFCTAESGLVGEKKEKEVEEKSAKDRFGSAGVSAPNSDVVSELVGDRVFPCDSHIVHLCSLTGDVEPFAFVVSSVRV